MRIDENGVRHYGSTDEGRQYVDAIENAGLDEEYRRQREEMEAMSDPQTESRHDYWRARAWGLPDDEAQRYVEACRLGQEFDAIRQRAEKAEAELAEARGREQFLADELKSQKQWAASFREDLDEARRELAEARKRITQLEAIGREYVAKTDPVFDRLEQTMDELSEAKAELAELRKQSEASRELAQEWNQLVWDIAAKLGCNVRPNANGNEHIIERARYLSSMFDGDKYVATTRAEKERDAALAELAELKKGATDPQSVPLRVADRELIVAERGDGRLYCASWFGPDGMKVQQGTLTDDEAAVRWLLTGDSEKPKPAEQKHAHSEPLPQAVEPVTQGDRTPPIEAEQKHAGEVSGPKEISHQRALDLGLNVFAIHLLLESYERVLPAGAIDPWTFRISHRGIDAEIKLGSKKATPPPAKGEG